MNIWLSGVSSPFATYSPFHMTTHETTSYSPSSFDISRSWRSRSFKYWRASISTSIPVSSVNSWTRVSALRKWLRAGQLTTMVDPAYFSYGLAAALPATRKVPRAARTIEPAATVHFFISSTPE